MTALKPQDNRKRNVERDGRLAVPLDTQVAVAEVKRGLAIERYKAIVRRGSVWSVRPSGANRTN